MAPSFRQLTVECAASRRPARWKTGMPPLRNLFSATRSIGAKLAIMTLVSAICMALVATTVLWIARAQTVAERIERAHAVVEVVWNLADGYYKAYKAGQMTEEEARKRFIEANDKIWYEDHTNYVYIYNYETGLCVSNPGFPNFVGKDMRPNKDAEGKPFALT